MNLPGAKVGKIKLNTNIFVYFFIKFSCINIENMTI